jgi:electron transport complex protein RnfD
MERLPLISSSPQIHAPGSTRKIMGWVLVALAPAAAWSIVLFGWRAGMVIAASVAAAVITEGLLNLAFKRTNTLDDLSAVVTGVLIGFNMPPEIPVFIPIVASVFAIAVVKWSFGGLGSNWMNPALAGRVFVFFSWGTDMTRWTLPGIGGADVVSGPTPLGSVKIALGSLSSGVDGPMRLLESAGMPTTYFDLFLGRIPGSLGEMSAMFLIAGALLLIFLKIVNWEVPVAYIGSFALFMWAFDGMQYGAGLFSGDVLFHLLTGGLMLGALFMATDLVTSPLTLKGRVIFGLGCGFLTFVIRRFGNLPEGVSLAIIFMNILVPLIDRFVKPKRYGVDS